MRAGIVVPELLDQTNHVAWFNAGATIFSPKGIQYLGVPGLINAKNIVATLIVQVGYTCMRTPCMQAQTGLPASAGFPLWAIGMEWVESSQVRGCEANCGGSKVGSRAQPGTAARDAEAGRPEQGDCNGDQSL